MNWLPRVAIGGWCACHADDRVFEGRVLEIVWHRWTFEIAFGREERR